MEKKSGNIGCVEMEDDSSIRHICKLKEPPCPTCGGTMKFHFLKKHPASCMDIIRWICTNPSCGYSKMIEVL